MIQEEEKLADFAYGRISYFEIRRCLMGTQFSSLFTMQNEHGQVMTWKLAPSQSFDTVRDELQDLSHRLQMKGQKPRLIIIDNCCAV